MAASPQVFCAAPAPTRDEGEALRLAERYLLRSGTHVASRLLGCSEPGNEVALAAELGDALLRSAALCDLADADASHRRQCGGAMDALDPSFLQVVGGWLLIAFLFVLREVASGGLKEAGKELWKRVRRPRTRMFHPDESRRGERALHGVALGRCQRGNCCWSADPAEAQKGRRTA